MFGESDSESPRVGSPWDSFISAPAPADVAALEVKTRLNEGLPKLVPEVEYGNVEYKLKLTNPSPERFLRLVTQMKWRLLEGGGQAYYELGIADSGHLVGLPRRDLELSLETLEMMAGEIGASVIIVKEIEVPAALVGTMAVGLPQRTPVPALEPEISGTTETETSTTEDDDDFLLLGLERGAETPPNPNPVAYRQTHFADLEGDPLTHSDFEIEIASVYKPRPHRARPTPVPQTKYTKRGTAPRPKRPRVEMDPAQRAEEKRAKRDARRDARRRALLVPDDDANETARQLQELHVGFETVPPHVRLEAVPPHVGLETVCDGDADGDPVVVDTPEPRLIVEALVVRKLALEEAFLDFGGFALEI